MANQNYIISSINSTTLESTTQVKEQELNLINTFTVNGAFDSLQHRVGVKIYSLDNTLLEVDNNFTGYSIVGGGQVEVEPINDISLYGYEQGDVKIVYSFTDDVFSSSKKPTQLFIESISPDRTEIRALCNALTDEDLLKTTNNFKAKLNSSSYLVDFKVNFSPELEIKGLNIDSSNITKGAAVLLKLYQPLPASIATNTVFTVEEVLADNVGYQVISEFIEEKETLASLKGPNFNIEISEQGPTPTEYFNYNELFSYPITSSNYELLSLFNQQSAQIDVDHTDYSDFIHFSSAEERLRNFRYKLDLVKAYEDNISAIRDTGNTTTPSSGSVVYYEGLIKGIVRNFDHYDKYLYFQSSSYSWPKSGSAAPYYIYPSSHPTASTWYNDQLVLAENYDNTNPDNLEGTVPLFLREDTNNEPYMLFLNMIGQHFDNLWVYFKAVSDKYDADNRLDFGISKDIVRDAIESFGVNIQTSNTNTDNLFSMFIGETPASSGTGSLTSTGELIYETLSILSGSDNAHLQPVSRNNYQKEVYKRIYHNLPLLTKGKGTERGLRALINCFGIPSNLLEIRQYGGTKIDRERYLGPYTHTTSSLDKIRLDQTGSIVTGSTLSRYTSITDAPTKYSDDIHTVEVGFNYSDIAENFVRLHLTSSFDIDDYIGDPRNNYAPSYSTLDRIALAITYDTPTWEDIEVLWKNWDSYWEGDDFFADPRVFVNVIKYFDNSLFRMIKDFVPARSNVNTGIIIQPHSLNRSKAKQVEVSFEEQQYTGSIAVGHITSSNAGAFISGANTNYNQTIITPIGKAPKNVTDESPKLTGEFSGSNLQVVKSRDLNRNNIFKKTAQPIIKLDLTVFNLSEPIPASCNIELIATYIGEVLNFYATGSQTGTIEQVYPESISTTSSFSTTIDYDVYEFISVTATPLYYPGGTFDGWYDSPSGGTLISDDTTLNVYFETQAVSGSNYYARFS